MQIVNKHNVNSEIFPRTLFLPIALKEIFATLKIQDWGMIYPWVKVQNFQNPEL